MLLYKLCCPTSTFTVNFDKTFRRESLRHLRSHVEPAGHTVGHRRAGGCHFSPEPVPPSRQEEELSDMKENGVDLNQQRHHSKAHIPTGGHSQTEARDHLRQV